MRYCELTSPTSHDQRWTGSPPSTKPHDHSVLKYQPTPLATWVEYSSMPRSKVTSSRSPIASKVKVEDPAGRQPSSSLLPVHCWPRIVPTAIWFAVQWISTACLWCMWLVQDAANVAVFLPRSLDFSQFAVFAGVLFFGLALLFRLGGDRIQQIVEEKAVIVDVRHATMIDAVFAMILVVFTMVSKIPMSTTWVFLGLLAGRELAINLTRAKAERRSMREVRRLIGKDLAYVSFGLVISIVIAAAVNPNIAGSLLRW